jgi:site-specific DNA recombinase
VAPRKKSIHPPSAADRAESSGVAVIYARYSSHNQREASIEQQIEECTEFAEKNNLFVLETYADKAVSGKTDRRKSFQRMLRDAEKGYYQVVIAYKSNRIGRNMLQALTNEEKLSKFGVRVLYAKEEFGDNAAGRFALRTMMNVNQFYSENMAEDIMRGLLDNAERCMVTGSLPLGYVSDENRLYSIDEGQSAVVREIFDRFLSGWSFADMASDLNERGIKTKQGCQWNKGSFHRILTNERYTGVYLYRQVRKEGGIPQIIDRDTWLAAQHRLTTKSNPIGAQRHSGDYLLTGKLFCGLCGTPMVGISGTGKGGVKHYYYACQKRRLEHDCKKENVSRDWIENAVCRGVVEYVLQDQVIEWMADCVMDYQMRHKDDGTISVLTSRQKQVETSIKNILAAMEQGIFTSSTKSRLEELEQEQIKLSRSIETEKVLRPTHKRERVVYWLEQFRGGDFDDPVYREKLVHLFVNAIFLYDDHMKIALNFSGNSNTVDLNFLENTDAASDSLCSYTVESGPPLSTNTNPDATLYFAAPVFVLVLRISNREVTL